MTLAALATSLLMLVGYAWLTSNGSAAPSDTAPRPGVSLTGGTIWWP